MMNRQWLNTVYAGSLAFGMSLAAPFDAHADVPSYDGSWKAPDVSIFLGSDILVNAGTDKTGTSLNETIYNYWVEGACTYDEATGEPSSTCDRLRFGLTMFRGPDDGSGYCPDVMIAPFAPKEDGGGHLTEDTELYKIDGEQYKISSLGGKTHLYCSDHPDQRPLGDVMSGYRDRRFTELGTNWPDRPQLHYHLIKNLPQDATGQNGKQVRESLEAACNLYTGNGNQHLSVPSWVMTSPNSTTDADLYAGMLAAAGGTGQCCYDELLDGDCDPSDPAQVIDMCSHLAKPSVDGNMKHNETQLRNDIQAGRYKCTGTEKVAGTGAMRANSQSEMKCHLQGTNCDTSQYPTNLFPLMACVQFRPDNIHSDDLAVHYCSPDVDTLITEAEKDLYNYRLDPDQNEECITLSVANGGIEYIDEAKHLFYPTLGGPEICIQIGQANGWTQTVCPNQNKLCDLEDGSQCSLGRWECVNEEEVCGRYPGNDSCDSGACGAESVHETGVLPPNAQFVVDRSGSMPIDDRWGSAREVAKNLATWSYGGSGCESDGTNCDKVRLGVHFWSGMNPGSGSLEVTAVSAGEDTTSSDMQDAFDNNPPYGGTDFHHGARLLQNEAALTDAGRSNVGIFVTDGISENAYTTREAARIMCDLRSRSTAPVATYVVGFADGEMNLNSLMAAAGGTGSCCFSEDGICDSEHDISPCEMYRYEKSNGQHIVDTFEAWLQSNRSSHYSEWLALNDRINTDQHTEDSYNTGSVADRLEMVDDVTRWLIKQDEGWDPQALDCATDPGDATSTNGLEFYKWVLCETRKTLSYPVRHLYNGNISENLSSWSDFDTVYSSNHDSTFVTHDYVCTGSKYADNEDALQAELQAILEGIECTYPLSLLDDMDSAPEYPDATSVKLYMPQFGAVVRVPHSSDADAQADFRDELCAHGVENCSNYGDDGWSFANEGRTAVSLSAELCDLTRTDAVEKVTTQVCRLCNPDLIGSSCNYVACQPDNPPTSPTVGDTAYTSNGRMCAWTEYPCPENPGETCTGWAMTGRCGQGAYACDDNGFAYCEQSRSRMPEICNGVDDDCDGDIDDLIENPEEWPEPEYDITGTSYDGWYCGFHDTCSCPGLTPDSIGGTMADGDLEFQRMLEHQEANGKCQCGEGIVSGGMSSYQPTRTYTPGKPGTEPKAGCSAAGSSGGGSLGAVLIAALLGLCGWRRRS